MKKKWLYPSLLYVIISLVISVITWILELYWNGWENKNLVVPGPNLSLIFTPFNVFTLSLTWSGYLLLLLYGMRNRFRYYISNLFFLCYSFGFIIASFLPLLNKTEEGVISIEDQGIVRVDYPLFMGFLLFSATVMAFSGAVGYKTILQLRRIKRWRASKNRPLTTRQKPAPKL